MLLVVSLGIDAKKPIFMEATRLNVRRMLTMLCLLLVLPVTACIGIDLLFDLTPLLTIISSVICIPLASFVVIKAILAEFDEVIQQVAPAEPEDSTVSQENSLV